MRHAARANDSDTIAEMTTPQELFSAWLKTEVWEDYRHDLKEIANFPEEARIRGMLLQAFSAGFRKGTQAALFDE